MDLQGRLLRTRSLLLLAALALAPPSAVASPGGPARSCASKDESLLLNLRVNMPALDSWDSQQKEWRSGPEGVRPGPSARIRVVHVWSTTCKPCEAEFPLLKQLDLQLRTDYRGEVQFLYIADAASGQSAMRTFMERNSAAMPVGLLFRDRENKLSAELLRALPGGPVEEQAAAASERQLSLPLTLLVDEDNVVRHAFFGSLLNRRGEFVNGLAQLYDALPPKSGAAKTKLAAKKAPGGL